VGLSEVPLSRFLNATRVAESGQSVPPGDWGSGPRAFKVISVTSNKGGVGKTTLACNLAVYLRAMEENLPILVLTLDDQLVLDRMFSIEGASPVQTMLQAIRGGDLSPAIELGQFGIRYVPASRDAAKLKTTTSDLFHLQRVLQRTDWQGLVIIDTKSDFEILTQNAIMASDLVMVVVKDYTSLMEAERVFDLLDEMKCSRERARVVLSLMDLRVKFRQGPVDVLELLVKEVRNRNYPLFESFLSRSAKIEALQTNPEIRMQSIMHGAPDSLVHRQMALLASEVLEILDLHGHGQEDLPPTRNESAPSDTSMGAVDVERAAVRPAARPPSRRALGSF
jgi:chromosome partitioning protein